MFARHPQVFPVPKSRAAFSLIELLTVMGVVGLLMSLAVPALSNMTKGSQMNQALIEVTETLEQARQFATAQNTYVWVVFNDAAAGTDEQVRMATLVSKSGGDLNSWGTDDTTTSSAQTRLISKPRTFNQVKLSGAGAFTPAQIEGLPAVAANDLGQANFTVRVPGGQNVTFNKAIQFTPSGEARTTTSMSGMVELGLQPTRAKNADANNVAVIRVNGLTGQTRLFRP